MCVAIIFSIANMCYERVFLETSNCAVALVVLGQTAEGCCADMGMQPSSCVLEYQHELHHHMQKV
jgi:hypothetical protein